MFDAHLQRRLLDGDLTEDSSAVVGTNCLQLLLVEREELSAGQNSEAGDGSAEKKRHSQARHSRTQPDTAGQVVSDLHVQLK